MRNNFQFASEKVLSQFTLETQAPGFAAPCVALVLRRREPMSLNFSHWTSACQSVLREPPKQGHSLPESCRFISICIYEFLSVVSLSSHLWSHDISVCLTHHLLANLTTICLCLMLCRQGKGLLSHLCLKSPRQWTCSRRTLSISLKTTLFQKSVWRHLPRWVPSTEGAYPWQRDSQGSALKKVADVKISNIILVTIWVCLVCL